MSAGQLVNFPLVLRIGVGVVQRFCALICAINHEITPPPLLFLGIFHFWYCGFELAVEGCLELLDPRDLECSRRRLATE